MIVSEVLRSRGQFAVGAPSIPWRPLICVFSAATLGYGVVMGTWSGRAFQVLYSGLKAPILLGGTTLICLPNFYVLGAALGLRDDLEAALRGVLTSQATVGLALASAAPLTGLVYVSGCSYAGATLANGLAFLLATLAGQWTLARHYEPLIRKNRRHIIALIAWVVLYQFVAIQLAWSLRPFIGDPSATTTFLRPESWTNAYVDAAAAMRMFLER